MAVLPVSETIRPDALRLGRFEDRFAPLIVSWARGAREVYWLAPRTPGPLTPEKVRAWVRPTGYALVLLAPGLPLPVGYGELNELNWKNGEYWLGHLIVDPRHRGCGLGRRLTELLLIRAFVQHGAQRVTLVVFPENRPAIACYRAAGMREDGEETHRFPPDQRPARLARFVATRADWDWQLRNEGLDSHGA